MNWFDWVLIAMVVAGSLAGIRIGFIRAALTALAVIAGLVMVGQVTDHVADWLANYTSNETLTTVLGYALTISVSLVLAAVAAVVVRKCVYALFLGRADRLAGLAVGLVASVAISTAAVISLGDLVYSPELPREGLLGAVVAMQANQAKEKLAGALGRSALVPTFVGLVDSFTTSDLAPVPSDFGAAVENFKPRAN